eukprot:36108-Eustigmatos_ZCMA.PRE.1
MAPFPTRADHQKLSVTLLQCTSAMDVLAAAATGDLKWVRALVQEDAVFVHARDQLGSTPLRMATYS